MSRRGMLDDTPGKRPEPADRSDESVADAARRTATAKRALGVLAVGAVVLAALYFTWRGVWRASVDSGDLAVGYAAGRALLLGHDPYDPLVLEAMLADSGGGEIAATSLLDRLRNVHLPWTLPAYAPLALFSWPTARLLVLALNVIATLVIIGGLTRLLGWQATHPRALAATAFVLALAPVHTTIALGQSAVIATAAVVASVLFLGSARRTGAFAGLATVLKAQVGLPFLAYHFVRRRWTTGLTGTAIVAGSGVLAVVAMQAAAVPWASSWLSNLGSLSGPGGINDPSQLNPERFSLINIQVLLFSIVPGGWVDGSAWMLVGGSGLILLWLTRGRPDQELLALSGVAVLGLLVAYHRYYDAVLLVFPIAWALAALGGPNHRHGIVVLVLAADFILPFQTALNDLQQAGRLPDWLSSSPFYEAVLITQHIWALILVAAVLLHAAARNYSRSPRPDGLDPGSRAGSEPGAARAGSGKPISSGLCVDVASLRRMT